MALNFKKTRFANYWVLEVDGYNNVWTQKRQRRPITKDINWVFINKSLLKARAPIMMYLYVQAAKIIFTFFKYALLFFFFF